MSQTIDSIHKSEPTEVFQDQVTEWLLMFEEGVSSPSFDIVRDLFHEDCHWRDLLALTWQVKTVSGLPNILSMMQSLTPKTQPYGFQIPHDHAAPRSVERAG